MSYLIKDLPKSEKPREKAKKYGFSSLSEVELLAILLRTGAKNISALDLARTLLLEYQDLEGLLHARINALKKISGMGEVKAITILAALELGKRLQEKKQNQKIQIKESKEVFKYFAHLFFYSEQEKFYVLFLDSKNYVVNQKLLFVGTANQSLVHPRDIFKEAILNNAVKILCIHNHPSGRVSPSFADEETTKRIKKIGDLMGISLVDHVIIGKDDYYSFLENRKDLWE